MGFAVWVDGDLAWAEGTHEYRPMGGAVIAASDLFSPRDFAPRRRCPFRNERTFVGLFASLEAANRHLVARRTRPFKPPKSRALPFF